MKPIRTVAEVVALSRYSNAKRREPERRLCDVERRLLWLSPARLLTSWRDVQRNTPTTAR